jgi:hypothetical protein
MKRCIAFQDVLRRMMHLAIPEQGRYLRRW